MDTPYGRWHKAKKKAKQEMLKKATSYIEQILEATPYERDVRPLTSHL